MKEVWFLRGRCTMWILSVRLSRCVRPGIVYPIAAAPGRIMAVRATSKHSQTFLELLILSRYVLKGEQEQCL